MGCVWRDWARVGILGEVVSMGGVAHELNIHLGRMDTKEAWA